MEPTLAAPNKPRRCDVFATRGEQSLKISIVGRALAMGTAALLFSACGGSSPLQPLSSLQQSTVNSPTANRKIGDLIYASAGSETYLISYPEGKYVGKFDMPSPPSSCADAQGDVFIPNNSEVFEFAHGGTTPIAILQDTGYRAFGCASDRKTGNLAVANAYALQSNGRGNIALFKKGSGKPAFYSDPQMIDYTFCGYDVKGNLFIAGFSQSDRFLLAELPSHSSTFINLTVNKPVTAFGQILWDGKYMALAAYNAKLIYRLAISGSTASVVQVVALNKIEKPRHSFAFQGNTFLTPIGAYDRKVGYWSYPRGGNPYESTDAIFKTSKSFIDAIALSVSPGTAPAR
jgi:hypothetical protein